ncbi:hypothetical protein MNBD_ALPHA04-1051 [hydrothermal vent metagenome]|uniref:DUF2975 domain-containing protein n=1 Tax=hydrothermal vent metagenome TaxID=652676 RepID=A0A3B0S3W4_9ZZZZ
MRVIRILMLMVLAVQAGAIVWIWASYFGGNSGYLIDVLGLEENVKFEIFDIILIMLASLLFIASLCLITVATFFHDNAQRRYGVFAIGAARAVRMLGYGLGSLWATLALVEFVIPPVIQARQGVETWSGVSVELPLDENFVIVVAAAMLVRIAAIMDKGRDIETENKQII